MVSFMGDSRRKRKKNDISNKAFADASDAGIEVAPDITGIGKSGRPFAAGRLDAMTVAPENEMGYKSKAPGQIAVENYQKQQDAIKPYFLGGVSRDGKKQGNAIPYGIAPGSGAIGAYGGVNQYAGSSDKALAMMGLRSTTQTGALAEEAARNKQIREAKTLEDKQRLRDQFTSQDLARERRGSFMGLERDKLANQLDMTRMETDSRNAQALALVEKEKAEKRAQREFEEEQNRLQRDFEAGEGAASRKSQLDIERERQGGKKALEEGERDFRSRESEKEREFGSTETAKEREAQLDRDVEKNATQLESEGFTKQAQEMRYKHYSEKIYKQSPSLRGMSIDELRNRKQKIADATKNKSIYTEAELKQFEEENNRINQLIDMTPPEPEPEQDRWSFFNK